MYRGKRKEKVHMVRKELNLIVLCREGKRNYLRYMVKCIFFYCIYCFIINRDSWVLLIFYCSVRRHSSLQIKGKMCISYGILRNFSEKRTKMELEWVFVDYIRKKKYYMEAKLDKLGSLTNLNIVIKRSKKKMLIHLCFKNYVFQEKLQ